MIIQTLLDWYTALVVGVVHLVPVLPDAMSTSLLQMSNAGVQVGGTVAKLGVLVPFDVINGCIQLWYGLVVWWFSMVLLRVVIWVMGR